MTTKKNSNFECFPLPWDTDYFGIRSARVVLTGIVDDTGQDEIMDFCKNYEFVTILNQNNVKENNHWIGSKTSAFLTDINIQFLKILTETPEVQDPRTYVISSFSKNDQIIEIAKKSFNYSRFFNDPSLPQEQAKNIYRHWTESAFDQKNKHFIICEREQMIAGFILFSYVEDYSVIELIAVDSSYQGLGVGKAMIAMMESAVLKAGVKKINVGTQIDNIKAAQFYSSLGFEFVRCNSTFHLWL